MKLRIRERVGRLGLVAAVAVAGASGLVTMPSTATDAEVLARPGFQLPIPCGQRWTTSTHSGHADPDMLDMINSNGSTAGTPVLASAGGYVSASFYSSSGGHMIVIDHGAGWQTRYLHMSSRVVGAGINVAIGRHIGYVGSTGASSGPHLHYEQKLNGAVQQAWFNGHLVPRTWSYWQHYETSANCGGRTKYWVDTFANAPGYSTPGGTRTGTLYAGTNYVFCKVWGPEVRVGNAYNHWWMLTDLDEGPANQYVSAYYLSRWGNDEARDNNGVVLPNCP
jgi:Peptidase family M23